MCPSEFLLLNFKGGGFNNQPQQLMFSSRFSEFHIVQEFAVNLYR